MHLTIGQASNMLGISICTLRRWDKVGKLTPSYLTAGGHRRYSIVILKQYLGDFLESKKRKVIAYARVSSHDQKNDLKRQIERLKRYCQKSFESYEVIDDLGSGMNYKKKGLKKLLKLILSGQVSKIILTHKDRLLRFGSELVFQICHYFGVEIKVIESNEDLTDEQILAFDVLEIITVFSARLYGKRSHQNRKTLSSKSKDR